MLSSSKEQNQKDNEVIRMRNELPKFFEQILNVNDPRKIVK